MRLIIFLKIAKKIVILKKETVVCDSFEKDFIEEVSLHAYFDTFY